MHRSDDLLKAGPCGGRPAPRVLLVDAGESTRDGRPVSTVLSEAGFDVRHVTDAMSGCAALQRMAVDALVLDLGLVGPGAVGAPEGEDGGAGDPGPGAVDLLRRAREVDPTLPVLVLGAADALVHRVRAIEWGADDYLVKPVPGDDLVVLLRARVQRRCAEAAHRMCAGRLELDLRSQLVRADGEAVALTGREFDLLKLLVEAGGRTVPRPVLQERLRAWGGAPASNAVDVHVHRIRRKVGRDNIRTFRGGYAVAA